MRQSYEVRISSTDLDLNRALALLRPLSKQYRWHILEIEGVGDLTPIGETMLRLERQVANAPKGKEVSWGWLSDLAKHLQDLINFRLIGESASAEGVEVELFDSSYWTIRSGEQVIAKLKKELAVR